MTEHQRRQLVDLHRQAKYSEDAIRQVELELDRFEISLDSQLATVQQPEETTPVTTVPAAGETAGRFPAPEGREDSEVVE